MIVNFYNSQFVIKRQVWQNSISEFQNLGNLDGHLQQSTDKNLSESLGLRFTKTFVLFCSDNINIKEGDRVQQGEVQTRYWDAGNWDTGTWDIITEGTSLFDVRFIKKLNYGNNRHLEIILQKLDD